MAARRNQYDNRDDRPERRRRSRAGTFFTTLLLVVAIGVFCFAAYKLYGYWREYKVGTDEYANLNNQFVLKPNESSGTSSTTPEPSTDADAPGSIGSALTQAQAGRVILQDVAELEDPATVTQKVAEAATEDTVENGETKKLPLLRNPINFTELNAINPDIIGWLRIGALDLSYPVAQAADNDFYLHRTFEKRDNFAGCLFLNCDNSKFFTDQNSIIYGHNMKNGSMFGTLSKFRNQETFDANPYFWIFGPALIYQYRIFSASEVASEGRPYVTRFASSDFELFLQEMSERSLVKTGVTVSPDDRIVTLSTCTGNSATRFILQGKLEQMYIAK